VVEVVVLVGAPGSGKSSIGRRLGQLGLRWRDWEAAIVERWGTRDAFVARKAEALPALHDEIVGWIGSDRTPAVFETTGLSDAPLLARLAASGGALVVRLDVGEEEALRRVAQRERGRHLSDEPEPNRQVWRAFQERVAPRLPVDLVIDTHELSIDAAAARIVDALGTEPPPSDA
jgi:shikimate kinase